MTQKANFNAEEWSLIAEGPPLAGMIVITAQRGGTLRESFELAKTYAEARSRQGESELLDAVVGEQPRIDPRRYGSPEELRSGGLQRLREAAELLESKASAAEVDAYKAFVAELAGRAAAAHREGGFLGVGASEVSDAEREALDEINAALDSPEQEHAAAG